MRRRTRVPFVLVWIALFGASVDLESLRHAHADWQRHLQAHELETVEGTDSCDTAPHWDRAHPDRHPACVACALSATPYDRQAAPGSAPCDRPRLAVRPALCSSTPRRAPVSAPTGRAPPAPLLAVA
jgi:hypothetical protein